LVLPLEISGWNAVGRGLADHDQQRYRMMMHGLANVKFSAHNIPFKKKKY
jgi:hypothetical protein